MFFYLCHLCIFPKSSQPLYPICFAFFCSFTLFSDNSPYCYLWSTLLGGLESGQGLLLPSMEDSSGEKIRLFFLPFSPCLPLSGGGWVWLVFPPSLEYYGYFKKYHQVQIFKHSVVLRNYLSEFHLRIPNTHSVFSS